MSKSRRVHYRLRGLILMVVFGVSEVHCARAVLLRASGCGRLCAPSLKPGEKGKECQTGYEGSLNPKLPKP